MGRPCTSCPSTTVVSCCGYRNLRVGSCAIAVFKLIYFAISIYLVVSAMSGGKEEGVSNLTTGQLIMAFLTLIGILCITALLMVGLVKNRRDLVRLYWFINSVVLLLTIIGLFTHSNGWKQVLFSLIYIVIDVYFQIVIRSYYLTMTGAATAEPATTLAVQPNPKY